MQRTITGLGQLKNTRTLFMLVFFALSPVAFSMPIAIDSNYKIELVTNGIGAADGMAFAQNGDLYVSDYAGGRVLKITSPATTGSHNYEVIATGLPYTTDLTFSDKNELFVNSSTGPNSTLYNVANNDSKSAFATGFYYPSSISSFGSDLYVSEGNGDITKIDEFGNTETYLSSTITPYGITFDDDGNMYYTEHITGSVYQYDTSGNNNNLGSVSGYGATFTEFTPDETLLVVDVLLGEIYEFDLEGNKQLFASGFVGKNPAPSIGPTDLVFDSMGNLYVGDGDNIWRYSTTKIPEPSSIILMMFGVFIIYWELQTRTKTLLKNILTLR